MLWLVPLALFGQSFAIVQFLDRSGGATPLPDNCFETAFQFEEEHPAYTTEVCEQPDFTLPYPPGSTQDIWDVVSYSKTITEEHCVPSPLSWEHVQEIALSMVVANHPAWEANVETVRRGQWVPISKAWHGLGIGDWIKWVDTIHALLTSKGYNTLICTTTVYPPGARPMGTTLDLAALTSLEVTAFPHPSSEILNLAKHWRSGYQGWGAHHDDTYLYVDLMEQITGLTRYIIPAHERVPPVLNLRGIPAGGSMSVRTIGSTVVAILSGELVESEYHTTTGTACTRGRYIQSVGPNPCTYNLFEQTRICSSLALPAPTIQTIESPYIACGTGAMTLYMAGVPVAPLSHGGLCQGVACLVVTQTPSSGARRRSIAQEGEIFGNIVSLADSAVSGILVTSQTTQNNIDSLAATVNSLMSEHTADMSSIESQVLYTQARLDIQSIQILLNLRFAISVAAHQAIITEAHLRMPTYMSGYIVECAYDEQGDFVSGVFSAPSGGPEPFYYAFSVTGDGFVSTGRLTGYDFASVPTDSCNDHSQEIAGRAYEIFPIGDGTYDVRYMSVSAVAFQQAHIEVSALNEAVTSADVALSTELNALQTNLDAKEARLTALEQSAATREFLSSELANSKKETKNELTSLLSPLVFGGEFNTFSAHIAEVFKHIISWAGVLLGIYNYILHRNNGVGAGTGSGLPRFTSKIGPQ